MNRFFISFILLTFSVSVAQAQGLKLEQESRIALEEVPENSTIWLESAFPAMGKVKWYREVTSGKSSFEAKFKYKGKRYSTEFAEDGSVEDVEIRIKLSDLANEQKLILHQAFSEFKRFKLLKLQEQWTAEAPDDLANALQTGQKGNVNIQYEAEFRAEIDGDHSLWEGLFDAKGQLLSKRKIVLRPTDNLDY